MNLSKNKNIIIINKENFEKILSNIKNDWFSKLHILSDFDKTLTKEFVNWSKVPSLISTLRINKVLWEEYSKKSFELFNYYNPIEIDPNLDLDYKKQQMSIWWWKHLDLLIKSWLKKSDIDFAINSWILKFREWVKEFLYFLREKEVPIIIISANWIWVDSNKLFLKKNDLDLENINLIWNKLIWSDKWFVIWREEPLIHVFNKDETILENFPEIYKKIKSRKNVILFWDSLWDPGMINWFKFNNLLKIWFLNDNQEILLEKYKHYYDVIITWDWDFNFINKLLDIN